MSGKEAMLRILEGIRSSKTSLENLEKLFGLGEEEWGALSARAYLEATASLLDSMNSLDDAVVPLDNLLGFARTLVKAAEASFLRYDEKTHTVRFVMTNGPFANKLRGKTISLQGAALEEVIRGKEPKVVKTLKAEIGELTEPVEWVLAGPVMVEGKLVGLITAVGRESEYEEKDKRKWKLLAEVFSGLLEKHFTKDYHRALLTGAAIPGKGAFAERLELVRRLGEKIGALACLHPDKVPMVEAILDAFLDTARK